MSNEPVTRDRGQATRTPELFSVTVFNTKLQIPVDQKVCFIDRYQFYGEPEAQDREVRFILSMISPEVGPPEPHIEFFIPYEYGGFDSNSQRFDVQVFENFIRPAHFGKRNSSVTIPGLYQDNKPVTVTITEKDFGAKPTIEITPA